MLGDSIRRRRPAGPRAGRKGRKDRDARGAEGKDAGSRRGRGSRAPLEFGWAQWLGAAVIVVLVSFGAGYVLATRVFFPPPATAGVGVPVPDLYGMDRDAAEQRLRGLGLRVGAVTEMASRRAAPGRVIAQEPVPEQQLRPGAAVALAVSAGAPAVRVPPLSGLRALTARDLLETAGFEVEVQTVRTSGPRDAVVRTEPAAGTVVRLPAAVTLIVNAGPDATQVPDTLDGVPPPPEDPA